jgi:hypothetical protein
MDRPLPVFLRPAYRRALAARAKELKMGDSELAARILSSALDPFLSRDSLGDQAQAEKRLLEVVDELTAAECVKLGWNEHLTAAVFRAIADYHSDLYAKAIAGGERNRINRLIGSRVKSAAGAQVKLSGSRPAVAQLPRSSGALIRRYTLLVPKSGAK